LLLEVDLVVELMMVSVEAVVLVVWFITLHTLFLLLFQ
jgi:hypothetical protein